MRINTDNPSTGKPVDIFVKDVADDWVTIAEAPDFSVPDFQGTIEDPDPADPDRGLVPGEVFFDAPLTVTNKDTSSHLFEVRKLIEDGTDVSMGSVLVPAGETAYIPVQGQRLLKFDFSAANGGRLQVKADTASVFDVAGSATESAAPDHAPDTESA